MVRRFRNAFIGLLAASLALHFWATNVTLNLTDTIAAHKYETDTERLRKSHFCLTLGPEVHALGTGLAYQCDTAFLCCGSRGVGELLSSHAIEMNFC